MEKARQIEFFVREAVWENDHALLGKIRRDVFVIEQMVPESAELDGKDSECFHVLAVLKTGSCIGTARMQKKGRIGRVAVIGEFRRKGVGIALMEMLFQIAERNGLAEVFLDSQTKAIPFYEKLGFIGEGPVFFECEIPHQRMVKKIFKNICPK